MASWPESRRILGSPVPRLDGPRKASGRAAYAFDVRRPGMLHGKILRSPWAHGTLKALDLEKALAMPGVHAAYAIASPGDELDFQGEEIAAVAAETEEQARDAARAIEVTLEPLPAITSERQALDQGESFRSRERTNGDPAAALDAADVTIELELGTQTQTHVCLESHGLVAEWDEALESLTVWASTQGVVAVRENLAGYFGLPSSKVRCLCEVMGGGFGSKFSPGVEGVTAAELARRARRPVRLLLERDEEHLVAGCRPSAFARIRAGASREGRIAAIDAETWGSGGSKSASFPFPYAPPYDVPASRRRHTDCYLHTQDGRAMRAPGHPQASFFMESVVDELADATGMDPVAFRQKNLPAEGDLADVWRRQLASGAERFGWSRRRPRGQGPARGPWRRGMGCGMGVWGGGGNPSTRAVCRIFPDGSVEAGCATQDLGTGTRTIVAIVAAEILGIPLARVTPRIGDSDLPVAGASGGSTTAASVAPAVRVAAGHALDALLARVAPRLEADPAALVTAGGRIAVRDDPSRGLAWDEACRLLGTEPIEESGGWEVGLSSNGAGGVQFAEVDVDVETGIVRPRRILAVHDCGLVVNRLTCESQVHGGVIMGLNYALHEERVLDPATGRMLNPDLEFYRLAGMSDIPEIEVDLWDMPERGVIGIGEPATIPTAAAIANAVTNAIGARVRRLPITPAVVLDALGRLG